MVRYIFLVMAAVTVMVAAGEVIPAKAAGEFVGTTKTVTGRVVNTKYAIHSKGRPTFLDLEKPYPEQVMTVVIWAKDRKKFPRPPEYLYGNKVIRVTGLITVHQGKPEIVVSSPQQIVIEDSAPEESDGKTSPPFSN